MREQPAKIHRLACWFTILLAALFLVAGCQSTGSQTAMKRDARANALADGIAWKKSGPSTAQPQEQWDNPPKEEPLRAVGFKGQPEAGSEPAPIPEIMIKDVPDAQMVHGTPVAMRHAPRYGFPGPPPVPNAPNEMRPVPLEYRIRPPDVLLIDSLKANPLHPVNGPYTVRPDGTVGMGIYPPAGVAGLTIEEARPVIARAIYSKMAQGPYEEKDKDGKLIKVVPPTYEDVLKDLNVNVLAYNSSFYYVIVDAAGLGEQVYRFPVTGNETVLDGISLIGGLQPFSSPKRIWVARKNPGVPGDHDSHLPVNWKGITQGGEMATNWQVMPGDRIYIQADRVRTFSNNLAKFLDPAKEILGITLLGSQTVNSIKSGSVSGGVGR